MPMDSHVSQCVEKVCSHGCDTVRATISALEAKRPVNGTEALAPAQRQAVLQELKAIMRVYDEARC